MNLHKTILEGTVPIELQLILREIIDAGKVTNHVQILALASLSDHFKNGTAVSVPFTSLAPANSSATSTETISSLKALSPSDQVKLAGYLLDCIAENNLTLSQSTPPSSNWASLVLQKQY